MIILLFMGVGLTTVYHAQTGGRKREKKVKVKKRGNHILTQYKSHGHADEFARGSSGRKGWLTRLFYRPQPAWRYKTSGSRKSHYQDNKDLFTRQRTKGHIDNGEVQAKQNKERSRNREHGNRTFKKKKHKRK